ncbi:relaxase/mobilization nuclease domain-containing protein, partial [Tenacibaculum aquimarinum]|uniref:relaxase/mobilization nuclease domain-containing protein n=1 Tax=Tenacibaculum aquimarinum TaxID=2910675 RepID=UPI001F0B6F36
MVGKGKSIKHGGNGMDYAIKKDHAEIIDKRNVVGENGQEIKNEFKVFQDLNHRCENNDISFVLSPETKNGSKLTNQDFKEIADDFLKRMKLDKHQAIVIKHSDKKHTHLHIYVNRIDSNGVAYKDKHIGYKSQKMADEVAQSRGLTRASEVEKLHKEMEKLNHKELKKQILQKHKAVLEHQPKDFKTYRELMKSSGVEIKPTINKTGRMQGYKVQFQGVELKASSIKESIKINGKSKQISPLTLHSLGVKTQPSKALDLA